MKHIALLLFISLTLLRCKSSHLDKECQPVIDDFFKGIQENRHMESITKLLSQNENINLKDSLTIDLENKFDIISTLSGKYIGNKLLLKRNIDDDIIIYSYLVKYEKKFYRYIFMFYNNGEKCVPYKFLFDNSIDVELEESLKLYLNNDF